MIPSSRPKLSDLYTLSQSKLLGNHTLHSGTYQYSPYMAVPSVPLESATWLSIVCNSNVLSRVTGIRGRKPRNIFLYRASFEAWGKNPSNMKSFNRNSKYTTGRVGHHRCRTFDMFRVWSYRDICLRIDVLKINCCLNILFIIWFLYVYYSITFGSQNTDPTQREGICSFADKQ